MVLCKVYLILLVLNISVILVSNTVVQLLFPKGFSITATNRPETKNVHFEVNVTRHNGNLTVASYSKRVRSSFMNKWTFAKRNVVLNIGDVITYEILVNDNVSESASCEVTKLPHIGALQRHGWTFNYDIDLENCNRGARLVPESSISVTQSAPTVIRSDISGDDTKAKLNKCEEAIFNSSLTLLGLQIEVEELRNITQQLTEFEEKYPFAKQLTLSGRIPPDGDPVDTVRFMISEKLDLSPTIATAFRESTYSIRFTVSTIIEKFEILEVARYVLATTKIVIS